MSEKVQRKRAPTVKTASFVATLPLRASDADLREAAIRFEIIRQVYNAVLDEALKRLQRMRQSSAYQAALALPKMVAEKPNPERAKAFRAACLAHGFTGDALESFGIQCKSQAGFAGRLGAPETQKIALRAFGAVQKHSFGLRGRPRFKGYRGIKSIEGKSNAAALRWREGRLEYGGLSLKAVVDPKDAYLCEALSRRVKYCRLLRRTIKGRERLYLHLILEGQPPIRAKNTLGQGVIGLDQGPSDLAVVTDREAHLLRLAGTVEEPWDAKKRVQRAIDRSRRATNPGNYNADGTIKKGPKTWKVSARCRVLYQALAEVDRRLTAERRSAHGQLQNDILRQGDVIKFERVSYKAFQRRFGRSVKVRAPGDFFAGLKRKAESAGATVLEFPTRTTRLSQYCHVREDYVKKPLSQRWHVFPDGSRVQRDLYSAWLARSVERDTLDASSLQQAWKPHEPRLRVASERGRQPASGRGLAPPTLPLRGVRAGRAQRKDRLAPMADGGCGANGSA